jgi:hypothetical protein
MATSTTTREVTALRVNGHGFQIAGDQWLNISKYADPADAHRRPASASS